jgi:twinkle protein
MNRIDPTQPLLITEGELDCLSAIEAGFKNAVSVPFGAGNEGWIEENWEWLEQFEKIIIWSDNDDPGLKMRKNVIPRLGSWRCFYVEMDDENIINGKSLRLKDINEVLFYLGKEKVIEYISNAREMPIADVVDFSDVEDFDLDNAEGIYTGIKELDGYLSKLFFGTFNIFTGINGSGKSTLLNQIGICEPLQQGQDVFCFSGELPHWQLKNWIQYNLAGRRHVETIKAPNQPNVYKVKPEIKKKISDYYKGRLFFYDNKIDRTAGAIIGKMTELARKNGTKVFIIDNFTVVDMQSNEKDKWDKQKEFVVNLVNFAANYNVLVILVIHPHKLDTIRRMTKMDVQGSSSAIDLAHRIIGVHRVRPKEKEGQKNGKGEYVVPPNNNDVMIDLFKDRLIGFEDVSIGAYYDKASRRFWTDIQELDKSYNWDKTEYKDKLPDPRDAEKPEFMRGD